ncbi:MAG: sulfurtransferase TusA family protein [Rhodobacteraceae bacterium]|jgi:tRNA 2-thiouridine synthesizing protein A|nr:sulfurtransferase TusA family protein [Paracoccaceae bacterium]
MTDNSHWTHEIDARGLLCPLPVLKARKRLSTMGNGEVLRLVATDPAAVIDVPHYCNESGNEFVGSEDMDGATAYLIRKA